MIGLDTNVIVRYIAQDDPRQSAAATRIFEKRVTDKNHGFISCIALCETLWVLGRAYRQPKEKLLDVVTALLESDNLEIERRDQVWSALADLQKRRGTRRVRRRKERKPAGAGDLNVLKRCRFGLRECVEKV